MTDTERLEFMERNVLSFFKNPRREWVILAGDDKGNVCVTNPEFRIAIDLARTALLNWQRPHNAQPKTDLSECLMAKPLPQAELALNPTQE